MITAKYPGICRICLKPTKAGDLYSPDSKTSWHRDCLEDQPPDESAEQLAERLGFRKHDEWLTGTF